MPKTSQLEREGRKPLAPAPDRDEPSIRTSAKAEAVISETSEAPQSKRTPATEPPQPTDEPASRSETAPRSTRRRLVRWALFALLPLAVIAGGYWYVTGGQVISTDDAYVEADKVGISTDVAGIVRDVDVTENQHVAVGQVLYRLDPRQFQIALDNEGQPR
jgi:membrane fusion protein (multidrug efflux system)